MDVVHTGQPRQRFEPRHFCVYAVPSGECRRRAISFLVTPQGRKFGRCSVHVWISQRVMPEGYHLEAVS